MSYVKCSMPKIYQDVILYPVALCSTQASTLFWLLWPIILCDEDAMRHIRNINEAKRARILDSAVTDDSSFDRMMDPTTTQWKHIEVLHCLCPDILCRGCNGYGRRRVKVQTALSWWRSLYVPFVRFLHARVCTSSGLCTKSWKKKCVIHPRTFN